MPKWILYGLAAIALTIVTVGMMIPSRWRVERSISVEAAPTVVQALVADPRRWPEWTEWNTTSDPSLLWKYSGPSVGVGAVAEWQGKYMGTGRVDFTAVGPNEVRFDVSFRGHESTRASIAIAPIEGRTRVTWTMEGDVGFNPLVRIFVPQMKNALGNQLDEDLKKLAEVARSAKPG